MRVQRTSGSTSTNGGNISQSFETVNSIPLAGKTVTLSFYARKGADYSAASSVLRATMYTGTGTDQNIYTAGYTGSVTAIDQNATLTGTWQRFSYTATLAGSATEIGLTLIGAYTGTASTNDYYEVTGIQLEVGSVATQFSRAGATIQGELAACQRYFYKTYNQSVNPASGTFVGCRYIAGGLQGTTTTNQMIGTTTLSTMRGTPSITIYDTAGNINKCTRVSPNVGEYANETVGVDTLSENGFRVFSASGTAAGTFVIQFTASAEL
jgi:hypothetical protein